MRMKHLFVLFIALLTQSCAGLPEGITPVQDFELQRYTGQWYEIARLDHRFERGLEQVTATYTIEDDGSVKVLNRGFSTEDQQWEDAIGKAKFAGAQNVGHLEVSFFGPFYGDYVIFELDKADYQYAFVTGSENTLWFLSRTPQVSEELKSLFIERITQYGYTPSELIFVKQQ